MAIKLYSSQLRKVVDFKPIKEGFVGIYLCGPTVYDIPHLGHGRSATVFDLIRRYFQYRGFQVKYVTNYTDIDDKMINRANERGMSVKELSDEIIPYYEKHYGELNVLPADVNPKATEHIPEIIMIIEELTKNGFTYVLDDGVYFDVQKYQNYGEISGQDLDALQMGARIEVKDSKRNPQDFVLWKFKKDGEPFWESPWGDGRPGWHIECSAMTFKHLGKSFDIHAGGRDLLFPHHECEVAQSVCAFGDGMEPKYWLHNGFLNIDNEKMSKSLNNFKTLEDILKKYDGRVIRMMYLQTHYRNPLNFSDILLEQSKSALERVDNFVGKLRAVNESGEMNLDIDKLISETEGKFLQSMDNDFDSSGALGAIFELIKAVNVMLSENKIKSEDAEAVLSFLEKMDSVMGFLIKKEMDLEEEFAVLISEREEARKNRDFKRADEIRDQLKENGILIEDSTSGTVWRRVV